MSHIQKAVFDGGITLFRAFGFSGRIFSKKSSFLVNGKIHEQPLLEHKIVHHFTN